MNNFINFHYNELSKLFPYPELELRILLNKSSIGKKEVIISTFRKEDIIESKFENFFQRRIKREPISKIVNEKFFWKYNFFVNQDVLDPRPDSETIIEQILQYYPNKDTKLNILDMCTGSGCLGISIAKEYSNSHITATDISNKALNIAKVNAKKLNCFNQINFVECNLVSKLDIFDIVISNPPYLSKIEYLNTLPEIQKYEPKISLVASSNGFEFYKKISEILPNLINFQSLAFIEIGSEQAKKAIDIFKSNKLQCLKIAKDINKLDRVLILNKC